MKKLLLCLLGFMVCGLVACGGSGGGPQSERDTYGRTLEAMQQAPGTLDSGGQTLRLAGWAQESTYLVPAQSGFTVDPITGRPDFNASGSGSTLTAWIVVAGLVGHDDKLVVTEWRPRTLWVRRGDQIISSRNLGDTSQAAVGVSFPNPPFGRDDTFVVLELVRGTDTLLMTTRLNWSE